MEHPAMPAVPADQPNQRPGKPPVGERIAQLQPVAALANMLQQLENRIAATGAGADQYREVAEQLSTLLRRNEPDNLLYQVLSAFPAAAELYENVRFEYAGLCLHQIDQAASAEQAARDLFDRMQQPDKPAG